MDFTKEFVVKGKWSLPKDKTHYCYGELSFNLKDGIILEIFGSLFQSKNILESKHNLLLEEIWGITQDSKCITLLDAFGDEFGSNKLLESRFKIQYAIVSSTHFLTTETDIFETISINLNCNEAFFSSLYKDIRIENFDEEGEIKNFSYKKTSPKELFKSESIELYLYFNYGFSFSRNDLNDFSFNQKVYFNNVLQKPLDFKSSISFAQNIKAIFSFFSTSKIFFNHLTLKEKGSQETFSVIFYQDGRTTTKKLELNHLLISYDEIKEEFKDIIKWWFENEKFISNGLSLYLQVVNLNMASPIQQFLSIVFAIETLHSSFYDKAVFTDSQIKKFKEEKKAFKMDAAFAERFNECMLHFNSMSFRDRVKSMIELNSDLIKEYIDNLEDFANKVKNQRNYYAHKHSTPTASLIKDEHQLYYNMMCKLIFEVTFLSLLGLKKETIKLMLKRHHVYNHYKQKKPT